MKRWIAIAVLAGCGGGGAQSNQPASPAIEHVAPPGEPNRSGSTARPPSNLPPECVEYQLETMKLVHCPALPQASKDAVLQGLHAMEQGWKDLDTMPPDVRAALAAGCKAGTDAMVQIGNASCPP